MKVLNMGSMNLDYVYRVHEFPRPGETITAISQSVNPGGKGLNQSVALSKAGAEVYHACAVGTGGEMLTETLKKYGVNTDFVFPVGEIQGNAVICVNDAGENNIVLFGGSNRSLTKECICETLKHFENESWLMLQNEVNDLDYIVREAAKQGLKIALNPSPCDEGLKDVDLGQVSLIFVNEVEGEALTGKRNPEEILEDFLKKYPKIRVVLTLGAEGAWYRDAYETVFQPGMKVEAVDTTAAGDTFSGYFLACMVKGMSISDCMKYATKAAGIAVTLPGACESIPDGEKVFKD